MWSYSLLLIRTFPIFHRIEYWGRDCVSNALMHPDCFASPSNNAISSTSSLKTYNCLPEVLWINFSPSSVLQRSVCAFQYHWLMHNPLQIILLHHPAERIRHWAAGRLLLGRVITLQFPLDLIFITWELNILRSMQHGQDFLRSTAGLSHIIRCQNKII